MRWHAQNEVNQEEVDGMKNASGREKITFYIFLFVRSYGSWRQHTLSDVTRDVYHCTWHNHDPQRRTTQPLITTWLGLIYCLQYHTMSTGTLSFLSSLINPSTPTVAMWVQLCGRPILCQTGLSRHLQFLTSWHSDAQGIWCRMVHVIHSPLNYC